MPLPCQNGVVRNEARSSRLENVPILIIVYQSRAVQCRQGGRGRILKPPGIQMRLHTRVGEPGGAKSWL